MELDKLHCEGVAFAKNALQNSGRVNMTFLALTQDDKLLLVCTPDFASNRDDHHHYLRNFFQEHGVIAYSVCSEVWVAPCAPGALPQRMVDGRLINIGAPPSQNPARTEAVVISTVGRDEVITGIFAIDRSHQRPALGNETSHNTSPATLENQIGITALLPSRGTPATHNNAPTSLIEQARQVASQRPDQFKARGPYPLGPGRN